MSKVQNSASTEEEIVSLTCNLVLNNENAPKENRTKNLNETIDKQHRFADANRQGKGHTVFDGCKPDEIQLFVEHYEFEVISEQEKTGTHENSNVTSNIDYNDVSQPNICNDSMCVPLSTLIIQFIINFTGWNQHKGGESVIKSVNFLPHQFQEFGHQKARNKQKNGPTKEYFRMKKSAISKQSNIFSVNTLKHDLSEDIQKSLNNIQTCILPALYIPSHDLYITGLCSVLRYLLQYGYRENCKGWNPLLGFQNACLSAPAEVSLWTRFCEIDLPKATVSMNELVKESKANGLMVLPEEFSKFEMHLTQPIRMFNIRKRMQNSKKAQKSDKIVLSEENSKDDSKVDPIKNFALSQHVFAEGPDCLLSDIILYIHYYIAFQELNCVGNLQKLENVLPNTVKWFKRVGQLGAFQVAEELFNPIEGNKAIIVNELSLPSVPNQSLYKSDPNRSNPASRSFTRSTKGMVLQNIL